MTTLAAMCSSIVTGMTGLTGMTSAQVSSTSWQIGQNAVSCFVAPAFAGSESLATMGGGFDRVDRVLLEWTFRPLPNVGTMYSNAATYLDRVLTWFRANDDLSNSVATCHAQPLTWEATEIRTPEDEIVKKVLTFTVSIGQYVG